MPSDAEECREPSGREVSGIRQGIQRCLESGQPVNSDS